MFSLPRPETMINFVAGLVGVVFDRVQNGKRETGKATDGVDDLTIIGGIGPTFAKRLNESGILTFGQLAKLKPDQVVEITHVAKWQADPTDWIRQAQTMV